MEEISERTKRDDVEIVEYQARFNGVFRDLNLQWIEAYFRVEKKDLDQVNAPETCLASGGQIFFAILAGQAVGTCAVYKTGPSHYEIAKMAVRPDARGYGIGDLLMSAAEIWAVARGASEIHILSNTVLAPAIALYQKHGYSIMHLGPHPDYERCNIELRKTFEVRSGT